MKEELLHQVWKTKRFDNQNLKTVAGESLVIHHFGIHNSNAGPDFLDARITIGTTLWAGHVEIHLKSSDWNRHGHQSDPNYGNVILHVVFEDDKPILTSKSQPIPTLVLEDRIAVDYINNYQALIGGLTWVPCANQLKQLDYPGLPFFLERVLVDRLEKKTERITELLDKTKYNWEVVLFQLILRYMGLKVNAAGFETLAEGLSYDVFKKQETQELKESMLLGQAGLLKSGDPYIEKLLQLHKHQKNKYKLTSMAGIEWKFSRLRPANFPTIRLAQIAALYDKTAKLFNSIVTAKDVKSLEDLLQVSASEYWDTHYLPGKLSSVSKVKKIGKTTQYVLIINAFIPMIFAYGRAVDDVKIRDKAIDLLGEVKAESNAIVKGWRELGIKAKSAAHSQALIELKTTYCNAFQCLNCQIGQQIIFK